MRSLRCFPTLLFSSWGGYNLTDRYPWIVEAARKVRQKRFVLDGEAVVLGVDGVSDFDDLVSRMHDDEVQLYTFDLLAWRATTCAPCRYQCAKPISRYVRMTSR